MSERSLWEFARVKGDRSFMLIEKGRKHLAQGLMQTTSPASLMRTAEPAGSDDIIVLTCLLKYIKKSGQV